MRRAVVMALVVVAALGAQATMLVPVWTGQTYSWLRVGPSFILRDGVLDVIPPPPTPVRVYSYRPAWDSAVNAFRLPGGARNVAIWLNGLRQAPGIDYEVTADGIKPLWAWPDPESLVLVDYDQ